MNDLELFKKALEESHCIDFVGFELAPRFFDDYDFRILDKGVNLWLHTDDDCISNCVYNVSFREETNTYTCLDSGNTYKFFKLKEHKPNEVLISKNIILTLLSQIKDYSDNESIINTETDESYTEKEILDLID